MNKEIYATMRPMFTGIIRHLGKIEKRDEKSLVFSTTKQCTALLELGSSIAVNGTCLTVTNVLKKGLVSVDVMPETWARTMLGSLKKGAMVNLELALGVNERLDGHFVQGHIDGTAKLENIKFLTNSHIFTFSSSPYVLSYLVEKGSVAVNGVSLTLIKVEKNKFTVGVIPHTLTHTMLGNLKKGEMVNVEVDILAKYVQKFLKTKSKK